MEERKERKERKERSLCQDVGLYDIVNTYLYPSINGAAPIC